MLKYAKNIRYSPTECLDFNLDLKHRVDRYFKERGGNRKATAYMWFKIFVLLASFFFNWYALAFYTHSLGVTIALIATLAFLFKVVAFNIAHDAVHGGISTNSKINDAIFWFTFNMLGPNAYLWKIRHNNAHHLYVNIPGCDIDIEGTKIIRFAPHVKWMPIHRFQHLYAPILYMFFTLDWIFIKDFKIYKMVEFGNVTELHHSKWRLVEMILLKLFYVGYMIVIPTIMLPYGLGEVLLGFIGFHMILSLMIVMAFVSSHIGMEASFLPHAEDGKLTHSFFEHQLLTSIDFHPRSELVSFFYGGFNSHVAHHMFPTVCSIHYVALSKIIKETATQHDLPYYELPLPKLYASHFKFLKLMGKSEKAGEDHLITAGNTQKALLKKGLEQKNKINNTNDSAIGNLNPA